MIDNNTSFWAYSLRFYDDKKTQQACLDVQDRLGADVNLILYILFKAQMGQCLTLNGLRKANNDVNSWRHDVVQPLRQVRRSLKQYPHNLPVNHQEAIRTSIKTLELRSEKFQQDFLETLELETHTSEPKQAANKNLSAYLNILGADISDPAFSVLLQRFDTLENRN